MRLAETEQFKTGKSVEAFLDQYFRKVGYRIEVLSAYEERQEKKGDRRFHHGGRTILVEYKSGIQTFVTGNIFLETVSVDSQNIPGWVYTCRADVIVYACLLNGKLLLFKPDDLRSNIEQLQRRFRTLKTSKGQNTGYNTHGVIVPLAVAEAELAWKVIELK